MKIKTELFGDQLGVENSLTKAFMAKEFQILITLKTDDNKNRLEFILNKKEAQTLINSLQTCFVEGRKEGFTVV